MKAKKKILFSILIIFVLALSASAISAADDSDAKMADSQDIDAVSASDVENIEVETADNDVEELSSPAESEILSEDKIDTSTASVEVVNGTTRNAGKVILDFSDIYDSEYPIYSEDTYLTINEEIIYGSQSYYDNEQYYYAEDKYVFDINELVLGSYKFTINYGGNDYYSANTFTGTYYVNEVQKINSSTAKVEVVNGTPRNTGKVILNFLDIYDPDYSIYSDDVYLNINGETIYAEEEYSSWSDSRHLFMMPVLDKGSYPFTIHYGGNDYYEAHDFSGTYHVNKIQLHVGINPHSVKEGDDGTIEVYIYDYVVRPIDDDGEPYLSFSIQNATLIVNNKEYKFDVEASDWIDGTLISIDTLPAGNYDIRFKFAGDDNYLPVDEFVADKQFSVISKNNKANINDIYIYGNNALKGHNCTIDYKIYGHVSDIDMNGSLKLILVDSNDVEYDYLAKVDEDGEGSIDLGWNLTGGVYTFKAQYLGNDYYNTSEIIVFDYEYLTIYDETYKRSFYSIYFNYVESILKGENSTFNVTMDDDYQIFDIPFTGKVKIILTNYYDNEDVVEYIVELDENGKGSIDFGYNLTGQTYDVSMEYIDDPLYYYEEGGNIGTLQIISEDNKAEIEGHEIPTYVISTFKGKNGTVILNFTNAKKGDIPFDGNVTIKLSYYDEDNGNSEDFVYVLDIVNDIATVDLGDNYNYNKYVIYLSEINSTYYCSAYVDDQIGTFYIYDKENKAPVSDIVCNIKEAAEGLNATITVDLSDSRVSNMPMTGQLKIILVDEDQNEYEYLVDIDKNGMGSIDLGYNLTSGHYDIKANYQGNNYYGPSESDEYVDDLNIYGEDNKAYVGSLLNYSFNNITKGQNTTITLDLSPYRISNVSMAGTLNITLINNDTDEKYYYLNDYVVDESGKCIAVLGDDLPVGAYYFELDYSGNDFYYEYRIGLHEESYGHDEDWDDRVYIYVVNATATEPIAPAATSLTASNVNINANPNSGSFKVTLKSNGAALAGQNVTITFNGKTYKATTNKNGVATFKLSSGVAKKYPVAITFAGNDKYLKSTAKAYVTVKKNNVKFSSQTKKVKKSKANKAKFKITLKTSNKKVLAKKLVYIKINKKTYKAKTNAKGVATFKLKLPKVKKTYKYTVTFKGDKANNKKTFKGKLAVK